MKMAHIKRVIFALILLLSQIPFSYAQNDQSPISVHALLNLSQFLQTEPQDLEAVNKAIDHKLWGLLIELEERNGELMIPVDADRAYSFQGVLSQIESLNEFVRHQSPIFIQHDGTADSIEKAIKNAGLEKVLKIQDSIVSPEKYFLLVHHPANDKALQSYELNTVKFVERGRTIENDSIVSVNGNKLGLFVSSIFEEERIGYGNEAEILRIYVNLWNKHGLPPVFLAVNAYRKSMDAIINALANFPRISGRVEVAETNVGGVSWVEHSSMQTVGNYCFPVINTSKKTLTPVKPGFRFIPEKVQFKEGSLAMKQDFRQLPLRIHNNLMGYYSFDNNIRDLTGKNNAKRVIGAKFEQGDSLRNHHIQLFRGDFVELPETKNFKLKNSSLTIAVWARVEDYHSDYLAILCNSERVFRKGLQLAIRNEKAYFGFWNMDLAGKTNLKPGQWNHIVGTYNFDNKEMSLYVNGKLDTRKKDIYSFIGDGQLFVGRASDGHEFNGGVDELMIWNRALGDNEIKFLYDNKKIEIPASSKTYRLLYISVGGLVLLLIIGLILLRNARKKRVRIAEERILIEGAQKTFAKTDSVSKPKIIADKINIFLFGVFRFYDNTGENRTHLFTPKVRDIFILILIYSLKEEKGIQSKRLSELLWPDLTENNAMNNKRVNINRLKNILKGIEGIDLTAEKKFYKIEFKGDYFCDYKQVLGVSELADYNIIVFDILLRGKFLETVNQLWADKLKSSFLNIHFDQIIELAQDVTKDGMLRYKAVEIILLNDPVNEKAIAVKVNLLKQQGKMNQAKIDFDTFCKEYKNYYSEDYDRDLTQLLS